MRTNYIFKKYIHFIMSKVLVTGGNGMVGKALQDLIGCNPNWVFVCGAKICDLRNFDNVLELFEHNRPDVVVHLASRVGGLYANLDSNFEFFIDNTIMHLNIVKACSIYNIQKLVNILSTCVFPDIGCTYPLTSDQLHNGPPHDSNKGYAYSKRNLHIASDLLSNTHGVNVINLIPTNLYGPYDNFDQESGHVLPVLVSKALDPHTNTVLLRGDGSARRQFLYSRDFARIILHAVNTTTTTNTSVIVAGGQELTIRSLVDIIIRESKTNKHVHYDTAYPQGQFIKTVSNSELSKIGLSDFKFTELRQGIADTIKYLTDRVTM